MKRGEFTDPLVLTTPHMKGARVGDAQFLLAGGNRFPGLATYKDGKIDKDYGLLSAQATKQAKFWVGYPLAACTPVFGQTLYEYLRPEKWRELPKAYQERRQERLAAAAETPGLKALKFLYQFEGYHEGPRNNETIFGAWYGWNYVAWCAIFESYGCGHTGSPKFHYASVELIHQDAVSYRNGLFIVRTPQPGDFALYRNGRDPYAHTGFYNRPLNSTEFEDFGGNTSNEDFSNGGYVEKHVRQYSQVTAFARLR